VNRLRSLPGLLNAILPWALLTFTAPPLLANTITHSTPHPTSNPPLKNFQAQGKVAFTQGKRGGNASIFWKQQGNQYNIRLVGALGAGSLEIHGQPGFVGLNQSNGERYTATDPEQLIKKVLGWDIPVSPLRFWLQGQMVPGTKSDHVQYDSKGQLLTLNQLGWQIAYHKYIEQESRLLPSRVTLQHGNVRLKFIFRKWKVEAP